MQWSNLTTDLTTLLEYPLVNAASETPSGVTAFDSFLPTLVSNAEQRIYRELDFLFTREVDGTVVLSTASRNFTVPAAIIVLQSANVITPAATTPANGTRNPLLIVSKDFIDQAWPTELSNKDVPQYLALVSDTAGIVAPTADAAYKLELTGIYRPAPISSTNTSTYISLNYYDLLLNACMVIACGYQRDFGGQSDDPRMAISWESQYQLSKTSTMEEEQRRKSQGTNWSPFSATPESAPRK